MVGHHCCRWKVDYFHIDNPSYHSKKITIKYRACLYSCLFTMKFTTENDKWCRQKNSLEIWECKTQKQKLSLVQKNCDKNTFRVFLKSLTNVTHDRYKFIWKSLLGFVHKWRHTQRPDVIFKRSRRWIFILYWVKNLF